MLAGGYYRGSSTLITGAPGTSKTTLAATFAEAACKRGERTLFVSFDEAPAQIVRNLESVGIRLAPHIASGKLAMRSFRSRADSPEAHAAGIRQMLRTTRARNLVVDPISAISVGEDGGFAQRAATEILDFAKTLGVTAVYTSMLGDRAALSEETPIGISTIADTWMHLTYYVQAGERNRGLTLIKSRGTPHSNQVRELLLTKQGVTLADVYLAGGEVLMGTLRWERESEERRRRIDLMQDSDRRLREAELALAEVRARLQATRSAEAVAQAALVRVRAEREQSAGRTAADELELRRRRGADRMRGPRARGR
jgi:circadian clock protein KaiC